MSKLLADPKVADLVAKEAAKAAKQDRKSAVEAIKDLIEEASNDENLDPQTKRSQIAALKTALKAVKEAA